jgi:hypothetical protein
VLFILLDEYADDWEMVLAQFTIRRKLDVYVLSGARCFADTARGAQYEPQIII